MASPLQVVTGKFVALRTDLLLFVSCCESMPVSDKKRSKRLYTLQNRLKGCIACLEGLEAAAEDPLCAICFDELSKPSLQQWAGASKELIAADADKLFVSECGHAFHTNCVEVWRRDYNWNKGKDADCPSCRGAL